MCSGLKATLPRIKVLEVFQKASQRHMSAEDVYRELLTERQDVGLATVYRVLTQFEQAGLLKRSNFESGKSVFELDEGQHHDHLVCLQCGRVEEFYDAEIETDEAKREELYQEANRLIMDYLPGVPISHSPPEQRTGIAAGAAAAVSRRRHRTWPRNPS